MRLTRDVAEELLDAGAGMFQIDFRADAEYFDAMAPPGKWEVVRDNLMGLFALISSRSFQPAVVLKDLDWRGETAQEREASLRRLQDVLGEAYSFVRYQSYRLHNWSGDFSAKAESHFGYRKHWGPTYHPCSHLWLAMNIHWNGNVSICCRDLLQHGVVGNVREQSLAEIWNGRDMRRMWLLMATKRHEEIPICRKCDRPWTGGYSGGSVWRIACVYAGSKLKRFLKTG